MDTYSAPRAMSAMIMIRLRSSRSTSVPAIGPNRNAGSVLAIITPDTASAAVPPPRRATMAVTATNPTQSPKDDTDIAARSRANARCVSRSLKVADRAPRRTSTSSAMVDTAGRASLGVLRRRGFRRGSLLRGRLLRCGLLAGRGLLLRRRLLRGLLLGRGLARTRLGLEASRLGLRLHVTRLGDVEVQIQLGAAVPAAQRLRTTEQQGATLGAGAILLGRVVHRQVALGVPVASVERPETGVLLHQLPSVTLRAGHTGGRRWVLLDVPALRIPAASHERPVATDTALELPAAIGARLVEQLRLGALGPVHVADVAALRVVGAPDELAVAAQLDLKPARLPPLLGTEGAQLVELLGVPLEGILGFLEGALERTVELLEHLDLAELTLGDVVELLLHVGREVGVDDVREVLDQLVGYHVADVLRSEPSILQTDVSAVLDRRDDRRVGGRTPDPELLELLHERSLGVTRRRLCEVLLRQDLEHAKELLGREHRQRGLCVLVRLVVAPLPVELQEPVERERLAGSSEPVAGLPAAMTVGGCERLDIDPHLVEPRVGHLRRDGPLPDQGVEPELIAIERRRDTLRRPEHARGADRLVGFLRVAGPGLVPARLGQRVVPAVVLLDELCDLAERRVSDRHGVRPHVGDQAGRSLAGQVEPLVEPLGERHGLAGAEPELASGFLLERRGRERRRRRALPLLLLHPDDPVGGPAEPLGVLRGVSLGPEEQSLLVGTGGELALGDLGEPCEERLLDVLGGEPDVDAPVFDRHERVDLALALDDQPHGHGLDAAGGQARLH